MQSALLEITGFFRRTAKQLGVVVCLIGSRRRIREPWGHLSTTASWNLAWPLDILMEVVTCPPPAQTCQKVSSFRLEEFEVLTTRRNIFDRALPVI